MTGLPRGWVRASIDSVAEGAQKVDPKSEPASSFDYIDISGVDGDAGRIASTQHVAGADAPSRARQRVAEGDVVVSTVRTYMRKAALVPPELNGAVASTGFSVLRPSSAIAPRLLLHAVRHPSFVEQLNARQTGSSYPAVRDQDVRAIEIALPPRIEQDRIVTAIEEAFSQLDAGEAALRAARQLLERMREAVLAAAVSGRLVPQDPTDTSATKLLADLGVEPLDADGLPLGWAAVTIGGLLQGIEAGKSFATQGGPARDGEVGVIKVSAMTWGEFRPEENKALPPGTAIEQRWVVRAGDLLLSRANTQEYVGACVLVPRDHPNLILSDKSLRLVPADGIDPRWLLHALRSGPARTQIEQLATGTKDSMRNISQAKIRTLRLLLPPAEEQSRIADELERLLSFVEACERAVEAAAERGNALRRSVLKVAFEGRLVPQDPLDEPAAVLLERIRAERSAAPPVKRRTRASA
jgi:type I restriction enzyme S subunit